MPGTIAVEIAVTPRGAPRLLIRTTARAGNGGGREFYYAECGALAGPWAPTGVPEACYDAAGWRVTRTPREPRAEAGDSGDGMQLTGGQFTLSTALAGNDLATFPDFPAEIRAPQGTLFGVSAFQINFGSTQIETAGDAPDVLVAMNPAALKTNLEALKPGGLIIAAMTTAPRHHAASPRPRSGRGSRNAARNGITVSAPSASPTHQVSHAVPASAHDTLPLAARLSTPTVAPASGATSAATRNPAGSATWGSPRDWARPWPPGPTLTTCSRSTPRSTAR